MSASGLLALIGALLVAEYRTEVILLPGALMALALAAVALAAGLAGLTIRVRHHRLRGGLTALAASGVAAAGGTLLLVIVPVALATGGVTGGGPDAVDQLAVIAMVALVLGTFVGVTTTGIGVWRSAVPSRGIGAALTVAGLLFLAPLSFVLTNADRLLKGRSSRCSPPGSCCSPGPASSCDEGDRPSSAERDGRWRGHPNRR